MPVVSARKVTLMLILMAIGPRIRILDRLGASCSPADCSYSYDHGLPMVSAPRDELEQAHTRTPHPSLASRVRRSFGPSVFALLVWAMVSVGTVRSHAATERLEPGDADKQGWASISAEMEVATWPQAVAGMTMYFDDFRDVYRLECREQTSVSLSVLRQSDGLPIRGLHLVHGALVVVKRVGSGGGRGFKWYTQRLN